MGEEISPRSSLGEKKSPREAHSGRRNLPTKPWREARVSCVVFFSSRSRKILLVKRLEARERRIEIGRAVSDLQVLPFLLPRLLSPSADIARNRPTTVKINSYCSTAVGDGRNQPLSPDFG
ncbi:hypothetical protein BHM03_00007010 [Ensete ventricosum]|nr:hypothetical protein BHM03_00007010 [Ensete ventricosum]